MIFLVGDSLLHINLTEVEGFSGREEINNGFR